eukprot:3278939-Rhodomonas_salina.2
MSESLSSSLSCAVSPCMSLLRARRRALAAPNHSMSAYAGSPYAGSPDTYHTLMSAFAEAQRQTTRSLIPPKQQHTETHHDSLVSANAEHRTASHIRTSHTQTAEFGVQGLGLFGYQPEGRRQGWRCRRAHPAAPRRPVRCVSVLRVAQCGAKPAQCGAKPAQC